MSRNYIDLVVVKMNNNKKYLFRAPRWSCIECKDEVFVDTTHGPQLGTVVGVTSEPDDLTDKDVQFLVGIFEAEWPLKKVLSRRVIRELEYDDEEDEIEVTDEQEESEKTE